MCGIASIFAYHYAAPSVDRKELRTIRDHMINRGPDGKGEWYSENNRIGLGHRRLSIIDLSDEAAQPMVNEACQNKQHVITYNGEIYNYKALRKELKLKGIQFSTHSDTEVLLHLYAEKGEAMVHDLRGMFAFAIWDEIKHSLFLARDPYGIKPLYYADDGWTVRIASQVKAILAGGKVSTEPEPAGIAGFYLLGSIPEPWTIYQNIRALPAGHTMWITSTGPTEPEQYFNIARIWKEAETNTTSRQEQQQQIREALLDTVKHHMVADVPVGAFLSAGIDSGALVGLMTEIKKDSHLKLETSNLKLTTITLAFEEFKGTQNDESPLAEQVASLYKTQHTTRYVSELEFNEDLPKILDAMDQPTIDGINTWFVAKAAKEQGLKVAVSGLGGDELFGGYPSFKDVPRWVKRMAIPSHIPLLGDAVRKITEKIIPHTSINPKASGMLKYGGKWNTAWYLRRGIFMPWELNQLMDKEQAKIGLERLNLENTITAAMTPAPDTEHAKIAAMESSLYMRNQLLRDADWAGMAHSLEIRVPLVDGVLLKKLAGILKTNQTNNKQPLAYSPATPLPENITERAKTGFTTPIEKWQKKGKSDSGINGPWARNWAKEVFGHSSYVFNILTYLNT